MYIIKNGFAYEVKKDKAYKIGFDADKGIVVNKDEVLTDIAGLPVYNYTEMFRKMNVRAILDELRSQNNTNPDINLELVAKVKELEAELVAEKSKVVELTAEKEQLEAQLKAIPATTPDEKTKE